jgi:hypothetical protein
VVPLLTPGQQKLVKKRDCLNISYLDQEKTEELPTMDDYILEKLCANGFNILQVGKACVMHAIALDTE